MLISVFFTFVIIAAGTVLAGDKKKSSSASSSSATHLKLAGTQTIEHGSKKHLSLVVGETSMPSKYGGSKMVPFNNRPRDNASHRQALRGKVNFKIVKPGQ